jgi:lysozyme
MRTFSFFLAGLAFVLTACGAPPPAQQTRTGPAVLSDRDPVAFAGRAPTSYPVQGIDAARFQKEVDWRSVAGAGIKFAFLKATEGGDLLDPAFKTNWRGAARAGIARGAYHFYYFCTAPDVQARWFIRNVPTTGRSLPPVLDLEWNPLSPTCRIRPPAAEVRRQARVFMDIVEAHYGQRPIIYTTPGFYEDNALNLLRGYEFWLRSTARRPREAYPGRPSWRFWQYTATGIVPGITVDTDINAFNGSAEEWAAWRDRRMR